MAILVVLGFLSLGVLGDVRDSLVTSIELFVVGVITLSFLLIFFGSLDGGVLATKIIKQQEIQYTIYFEMHFLNSWAFYSEKKQQNFQ